jgi:hypothetical protein
MPSDGGVVLGGAASSQSRFPMSTPAPNGA